MTYDTPSENKEMHSTPTVAPAVPCRPSLSIVIPPANLEESIIKQLRYLETPECRAQMGEAFRIIERKIAVERFKNLLRSKEHFRKMAQTLPYSTRDIDSLYN